ncbi:MAG: PTS system mannose/fructose/sorbose family transporter subunit IID [Desulfonauticus sp.]|nr:PTS system mannose/fructose/sorbose family transporter subunit IID [Desulfonauticus sp.]
MNLKILSKCFLKTYFVNSLFNIKGLQNLGLFYAMDPALKFLYAGDKKALRKARLRYLKLYNSHPFWTPFLVGIFIHLEKLLANNKLHLETYSKLRPTIVYTLSAIGDSFFSGSLLPCWALLSAIGLYLGWYWTTFFFVVILFLGLQVFKLYTFFLGYTQGLQALQTLKKWNLINASQYLKVINTGLILIFVALNWPVQLPKVVAISYVFAIYGLVLIFRKYIGFREIFWVLFFICYLLC